MKILLHALLLFSSFALVFIWAQTLLTNYTIQLLALLIAIYFILSAVRKKKKPETALFGGSADIFILNTSILLLITITGNLYSPLFFLLYFLGFGITFIFEPTAVFIFAIGTVSIFLPEALKNGALESYIRLGSIILISPLAFFFGQEYKDRDAQEAEIVAMEERSKDAADTISTDIEEVLQKEKSVLKPEEIEKLNEILEETQELREEANQ